MERSRSGGKVVRRGALEGKLERRRYWRESEERELGRIFRNGGKVGR